MIIKHEGNNVIKQVGESDYIEFFDCAAKLIKNSLAILQVLEDRRNDEIDEDDEIELLEELIVKDVNPLYNFANNRLSKCVSINHYLDDLCCVATKNNENVALITDSGVYVTEEWAQLLTEENEKLIGGLCHVLWFEFQLALSWDCLLEKKEIVIDQIPKGYWDSKSMDAEKELQYFAALRDKYKFQLLVFDEFPEKEEEFLKLMGPDLCAVDDTLLTVELVDQLLNGSITPKELLEALQQAE